ncbi:MAG: hypothetical protein KDC87_13945, partial [Planctomycetes bacterium]|nr:hypothetical protein [Planctomycetota bacterium]
MSRPHRAASEPAAPRAQRRGGPTRREFGGLTVAAAAYWLPGCAAPPPASRKRPSRLRVGVIGLRVQGQRDLIDCVRHPRVDVRAVCDVDMELAVQAGRAVQRAGAAPAVHQDLRRLLDDPSLDAVVVATPD